MRLLTTLFLFWILLIVYFGVIPKTHTSYAQVISVGTQSSGVVSVSTKYPFSFDGLWDSRDHYGDYRIELGVNGDDDRYIQYNLRINENANCSPADFGDDEPNKNEGALTASCELTTVSDVTFVDMEAQLNISALGLQQGETYNLKLKRGTSGNDEVNTLSLRVLGETTLEVNPSAISAGTPVTVTITNLAPYTSYRAFLTLADGTESTRSFVNFTTTQDGCQDLPSGVFTVESCQLENGAISTSIRVNTSGYNCTPGGAQPPTFSTCFILVREINSSGTLARDTLEVYTNFTIDIEPPPNSTVSQPGIAGDPIAPYNFYEGQATVVARGCIGDGAEVTFRSYKDAMNCDGTNCSPISGQPPTEEVTITSTDAVARWSKKFDPDSNYARFLVTATCNSQGNQTDSTYFTVFSTSASESDAHIILPERIIKDQDWSFIIQGLDEIFGVRFGLDNKACYFYQLLRFENGTRVNLGQGDGDCGDLGLDIDRKYRENDDDRYFRAFEPSGPEETMSMPGLASEEYEYEIRLYKVDLGNNNDSLVDSVKFCVAEDENDASCDNELRETSEAPPPPNPPCANNIDIDGKCSSVNTALGLINVEPTAFITRLLGILLSISGGIAVLIISLSGYRIMTSAGNPEVIQEARERLTSAIVGLLFIIFSLVIIQVIGVDILRIPGFG